MRECLALVDEGVVDREGLDLNVKWGIGYKLAVIPPMQLLDMAGLDIYTTVASYLNQDLSNEAGHLVDDPGPHRAGSPRHQDQGRHLRLHGRADRPAPRDARPEARRRPQGDRLAPPDRPACHHAARGRLDP